MKVVAEYTNRTQAEIALGVLEARGIDAFIQGDDLGGQGPGQSFINRVQILVHETDADEATALLAGE